MAVVANLVEQVGQCQVCPMPLRVTASAGAELKSWDGSFAIRSMKHFTRFDLSPFIFL
eukprot:CAMPEP_0119142572 /NCGR_PEP_ID=MMETSP1310-20130426/32890_1 /TAXON_ID=464262 /ORGANISM="Genus nov. species nov., Strain RCC2339" /LENGTH=57 /DNA_ID=CAMNT_0007134123 /DNA_START=445 /DNA_END=618 /DNA_ORIENTATION=+